MKKFFLIALCFFFACTLFIMLRSDREGSEKIKIQSKNSFIEGLKILHRKNGNTVWTLTSRKADFTEDGNMAELNDLTVTVQKNGMAIYADKGIYDLSTRNFTINTEIRAEAKDYQIKTSSIDYDASSGNIETDEKIIVEGKKFKVEGKGMTLDSEQKVRIRNDVKATFYK